MKLKFGVAATETLAGILMAFSAPLVVQLNYLFTGHKASGVSLAILMTAIVLGCFLAFHGMYREIRAGNNDLDFDRPAGEQAQVDGTRSTAP